MSGVSPETIAFLGGFPPRLCGIATFTHDLCQAVAMQAPLAECYVCAVNDAANAYSYPGQVRVQIEEQNLDSYRRAADSLNLSNAHILCVQHEFGIYGGPAGRHVLALLKEVRMPVVTTMHTVLEQPDAEQRRVVNGLAQYSDRLVVMAKKGAEILQSVYGVSEHVIDIIPHGIPDMPYTDSRAYKAQFGVGGRSVLLTFGLLGPGKGIEYVIEALPEIVKHHPDVVYLILGATHPHLVAREGEQYRLSLERRTEELGVTDHVIFHNRFVSLEDLKEFIGATDVYITPYLNAAQITSGTLAYVFGAGKAVVSTPYWHAQELLADDRGSIVPFRDAPAIARAVCAYLGDPQRMQQTRERSYDAGRGMIWPVAASRYLESFERARVNRKTSPRTAFAGWTLAARPYALPHFNLEHLKRMSDDTGIVQHATFTVPNRGEGYCTDDNARAFILCTRLAELHGAPIARDMDRLATCYLSFLAAAYNERTGRFRNFLSYGREWIEEAGSEDSHARALWALGCGAGCSRNAGHVRSSIQLFEDGVSVVTAFSSPRAWAFTLLGICEFLGSEADSEADSDADDKLVVSIGRILSDKLLQEWSAASTDAWQWFEDIVSYENARLSQALIVSGYHLNRPDALRIGLASLAWLVELQKTPGGQFRPIGSNGFYVREGVRAEFDQQPVEAQATVAACLAAYRATGDPMWMDEARRAFEWFLGRNDLALPVYDAGSGGCGDGLHRDRVNANQGAESTLAYLLSLTEMHLIEYAAVANGDTL